MYRLIIFFTFLTYSCNSMEDTSSSNIIPVASTVGKYNMLNLSDYVSDVKYVPLETNDSVLIGSILQICCEDEKILIRNYSSFSNNDCYLFDTNGKFCNKIGLKGQGPYDFIGLSGAFLYEGNIYLMAHRKILIYDLEGHLIKIHNVSPDEYFSDDRSMFPLDMNRFIAHPTTWKGDYPKAILLETDQSGLLKTIKEYPNYVPLNKNGVINFFEGGIMYRYKDDVRSFRIHCDTIFTIGKDTKMKDAFIFDFGKYKTPIPYIFQPTISSETKKYITINNAILESSNHLFISFDFRILAPEPIELMNNQGRVFYDNRVNGVFDKRTGKLLLMKQPIKERLGFKNDIDGGPVIWPHYISANNELISYISAEEFLYYYNNTKNPTPHMTEIAKKITPDNNEIVIIAKLKE